ncbi:hypothetical protein [Lacticaseibacillus thailandensis]|uniref:hypothetical protein n=1 Tax=Lacticaseibacillus thailandensis TaxID=381741 RepID=UPI0006D2AE50|nr:hypothetical protein [Lacticaseibacillus thailandensis]
MYRLATVDRIRDEGVLMVARMIRYYDHFTDDFVTSAHQQERVTADYQWEHPSKWWQVRRRVVTAAARLFGAVLTHGMWHVRWVNRGALRQAGPEATSCTPTTPSRSGTRSSRCWRAARAVLRPL